MPELRLVEDAVAPAPSTQVAPAAAVAELARGKLQAFAGTIDPATGAYLDDVYAQNKSLAEHVAADYHGRFLLELVQNGNDAHPRDRTDGEIEILLREGEGGHGTLYVANRGNAFRYEDVVALTRIGLSSKPPGEAIGNKGLGFRSVSHVCDAPEIYSQTRNLGHRPSFEGYCFSFARADEFGSLIADAHVLALARADLPIFFLPRWLDQQNAIVRSFAERGFASVIRLVLRDQASRRAAEDEIMALNDEAAPLLLFLERLSVLRAVILDADGAERVHLDWARDEQPIAETPRAAICTLGSARWLILRDAIDEAAMRSAILAGVDAKQLHGSWSEWRGAGEVALAARLDADVAVPRLYTHLPMGEGAAAPFAGHLHGTFFPTSNRKALDASVALNHLLLTRAAQLAAHGVTWLADPAHPQSGLPDISERARACADLTAWTTPPSLVTGAKGGGDKLDLEQVFVGALERLTGRAFPAIPAMPCSALADGALSVAFRPTAWTRGELNETATFTVETVATHGPSVGASLLWPGLGTDRVRRLTAFLKRHGRGLYCDRLAAAERADIAAAVAASYRAGRRPDLNRWAAFYRDLAIFLADAPEALRTKTIVLCDDGTVRGGRAEAPVAGIVPGRRRRRARGEAIEPSLFFPPAPRAPGDAEEAPPEQLTVPKQLASYFAFVTSALPWHGELRGAREFLEKVSVSAYDGEAVLTRIAQVVNAGATVEQALAGLRWAFAIWRRASDVKRPIKIDASYRLLVPCAAQTLIPATEALFSETWPEHLLGRRLQAFLGAAPPGIADLTALRDRRLASTDHRAFGRARIAQWAEFLEALGVRRGLQPVALPAMPRTRAWEVTSLAFAAALGVTEQAVEEWRRDLKAHHGDSLRLGYTTHYRFQGSLWWLPGQGHHQLFSSECRELYAGLVVEWLAGAGPDMLRVTLAHEHFTSDARTWPTPAAAFVRSAEWLPADNPAPGGAERHHYRPADVWAGSGIERYPPYLRQLALPVHRVLERRQPEALQKLSKWADLRVLGRRDTLVEQLAFLADQFGAGGVGRYYEPQLANLYAATWRAVADRHAALPEWPGPAKAQMKLLVRRAGELTVLTPGGKSAAPIYVRDTDDELAPALTAALGAGLLDVKGADRAKLARAAAAMFGKRVSLLTALNYAVRVDDVPLADVESPDALVEEYPWLRLMLAAALEALKGTDASQLPADRSILLDRLAEVRHAVATTVTFELDGTPIPGTAEHAAYQFTKPTGEPLVVVLRRQKRDWTSLDACLPAVCDAIGVPSVTTGMRLLAWVLRDAGEEIDLAATDDETIARLCRALHLDGAGEASVRQLVGGRLDARMPWLRAALHYAGGADAVATLHACELARGADVQGLVADVRPLAEGLGVDPDAMLEAARRAFSTAQFRDLLDLDFARFNASLAATDSEPITHPELHLSQLANHIVEHEIGILEVLRNMAVERLDLFEPEPRYKAWRDDLRGLTPDPEWLAAYHIVPEAALTARVATWLDSIGAPSLAGNQHGLPSLADVRLVNGKSIARFASAAAPLVRAWWKGPAQTLPAHWRDAAAAEQRHRAAFDAAALVDARPLDDAAMLRWSQVLGLWPTDMPLSLEWTALGITEDAVGAADAAAKREAEERAAAARSVHVNGRDIDPEKADWSALSAEIAETLSRRAKAARLGTPADLAKVVKNTSTDANKRRTGGGGGNADRVPAAKKEMIGKLGELVVYHWLKERYPNQDIDKAWVSGNAKQQHAKAGSDDLGYDFKLELDRRIWLIEVKASQGDSCRFEMGETEVREARRAAKPRAKERYVVVYVADPGRPASTRIDVLPNPLSDEGASVLEMLGEGVRFGFKRQS